MSAIARPARLRSLATLVGPVFPALPAGLVAGLLTVINAIAFAGLIFSGPMSPGLLVGVSAILSGATVSALLTALASSQSGVVAAPFSSSAVGYVLIADALAGPLMGLSDPSLGPSVLVLICGLATLISGSVFLVLGLFRLGFVARFLPYPVISGYSAGLGWVFMIGAITFTTGTGPGHWLELRDPNLIVAALCCMALGCGLAWMGMRLRHWALIPGTLAACVAAFHGVTHLAHAEAAAWLIGPFPPGPIWRPVPLAAFFSVPWSALPAIIAPIVTIVLVAGSTLIMNMPSLEIELRRNLDFDREMTVAGAAIIVSGMAGGIVSAHGLGSTSVANRMGGSCSRITGLAAAAVCAAVLLSGADLLALAPRFVVGALLFANGFDRVVDRVWKERHRLPRHELAVVVLVLLSVIFLGYLQGVAVGLALTIIIFAWNYRRIPVVRQVSSGAAARSSVIRSEESTAVLGREGAAIQLCRLQGYLFFLNASELLPFVQHLLDAPVRLRWLILDFKSVVGIDSSAALIFQRLQQVAREAGFSIEFTELSDAVARQLRSEDQPAALISTDRALRHAEDMLLAEAGLALLGERLSFAALISKTLRREVEPSRLEPLLDRLEFAPGDVLIRQGDVPDALYFIERGSVAVMLEREDGRRVRLRTTTSGVVVGEVGIYTGRRRTANVIAETPCSAMRLSLAAIERLEQDDPELANLLHRFQATLLADKLADSNRLLERLTA